MVVGDRAWVGSLGVCKKEGWMSHDEQDTTDKQCFSIASALVPAFRFLP